MSCFTAALNEDIEKIVESSKYGFKYTPYLKIKLDNDLEKGVKII